MMPYHLISIKPKLKAIGFTPILIITLLNR
jgi:hypothetical protein